MKKSIQILYRENDQTYADVICSLLSEAGYDVNSKCLEEPGVFGFIQQFAPDTCQLFISINAIGFPQVALDGGSIYNRTPINTLVVMTDSLEKYSKFLAQRINYTTHFLVSDPSDVDHIKQNHPHIYHVKYMDDISFIVDYLDDIMDWRF